MLSSLGAQDPRTYIQSGNAAYQADRDLSEDLADAIQESKGFRPEVTTLSLEELEAALAANPFPEAVDEPKTLHVYFLSGPAHPDAADRMNDIKTPQESFVLADSVLYLHSPRLLTGSKIAAAAERLLGVSATARNWRSVGRVLDLARSVAEA